MIGILIQVGVLWLLIALFTESTDASETTKETLIVSAWMVVIALLLHFLSLLIGPYVLIIQVLALCLVLDKVCQPKPAATVKICVGYFVTIFLISYLSRPQMA